MKHALLLSATLVLLSQTAAAQPGAVESVPLSQPTYTLKNETDPMALDAPSTPSGKSVNKGEAVIAPPPPGEDNSAREIEPVSPPPPVQAAQPPENENPNYPYNQTSPADVAPSPPVMNSTVTGLVPKDESKFERMRFCTLKISFTSMGAGTDAATGDKIKAYLDTNASKLTYTTSQSGKEGEYAHCIDIPEHNNRSGVYKDLKQILANSKPKAPVNMTGKGFAPYSTKKSVRD